MTTTWTEKEINFLLENYSNSGAKYCANFLNRTSIIITKKANRLGLKQQDIYNGNKRDFSQIFNLTNPKIVYLLGLIWADGNVHNSVSISMVSEDLDQILESLDITNLLIGCSIRKHQQRENWKPQTTLLFGTKEIINFLKENGYTKNRLEEPKILELIPKELHYYWFRGLMDGDGSFNSSRKPCISLTGNSNSTYKYIQNLLHSNLNVLYRIQCRTNKSGSRYSRVSVTGFINTKLLVNYLYKDWEINPIGLNRKRYKALEILNLQSKYKKLQ
jgi:hypothetical protein